MIDKENNTTIRRKIEERIRKDKNKKNK